MGGADRIRDIVVDHNSKTKHRASLQQKLFVLDYIKLNGCSLSQLVKHFISIGCTFKISVSTVSDWKVKESKLRSLLLEDLGNEGTVEQSVHGGPSSKRPKSVLLSRRVITTFKYPFIVEKMESFVQEYLNRNETVNETVLISLWKRIARDYQSTYGLTDEFINKGPSKGFIYRFKLRNGLGSLHERKLKEEIFHEKENLNGVGVENINLESLIVDPSIGNNNDNNVNSHAMTDHNVFSSTSFEDDEDRNLEASIINISHYLDTNRHFFRYSTGSFITFVKLYQQERKDMRQLQQQQQQQQQQQDRIHNNRDSNHSNNNNYVNLSIPLPPLPDQLRNL